MKYQVIMHDFPSWLFVISSSSDPHPIFSEKKSNRCSHLNSLRLFSHILHWEQTPRSEIRAKYVGAGYWGGEWRRRLDSRNPWLCCIDNVMTCSWIWATYWWPWAIICSSTSLNRGTDRKFAYNICRKQRITSPLPGSHSNCGSFEWNVVDNILSLLQMPSTNNVPFWRKYFTVEVVVFLYYYGLPMYLPIGGIYMYQRVSDIKGFPYQNISQEAEGSGCGREHLGENSSLWDLGEEVCCLIKHAKISQSQSF